MAEGFNIHEPDLDSLMACVRTVIDGAYKHEGRTTSLTLAVLDDRTQALYKHYIAELMAQVSTIREDRMPDRYSPQRVDLWYDAIKHWSDDVTSNTSGWVVELVLFAKTVDPKDRGRMAHIICRKP